jgi:transcriptional regulator with XRE-family HTH domain
MISRKFADELAEKAMRDAYLEAQTRTKLAQQIRALRVQRGWQQRELGHLMGKPQGNVARLEDREIARYTLTTLFELAAVFDIGFVAKFVTYEDFLRDTDNLNEEALKVRSFNRNAL